MDEKKTLGETLRALRTQSALTQTELGEKLNISAQAVSKWERDESQPDIATLKKLADIYGVSVLEIIEPGRRSEPKKNEEEAPAPTSDMLEELKEISETVTQLSNNATSGFLADRYDIYISEEFKDGNYLKTIAHIGKMFDIDLAERKKIVDNFPYALTGAVTEDVANMLDEHFAVIGVKLVREPAKGQVPHRKLIDFAGEQRKADYIKKLLKKRFIVANITAAIPAIATMIFLIINKEWLFDNALLGVYAGVCVYSTIFLLWYPSVTRSWLELVFDIGIAEEMSGCFMLLPKVLLCILLLAVQFVVSPIIYAFSLPRRIKRMREGDDTDDIFN